MESSVLGISCTLQIHYIIQTAGMLNQLIQILALLLGYIAPLFHRNVVYMEEKANCLPTLYILVQCLYCHSVEYLLLTICQYY